MNTEKIRNINDNTINTADTFEEHEKPFSGRVDINHLIARARKIKEKENKINLVFFGLFLTLVLVSGIILSL